ncbi:MAG: CHASE2 domain-containing protein [Bdellovibrionales bacterium]|nr:CHASE2 domain-containing protein [Bdellovibrionales bacterium]
MVDGQWFRDLKAFLLLWGRYLWRRKAVWMRAGLAWLIGSILIFFDHAANYDLRFQIRGQQNSNSNIVLLEIDQNEWIDFHGRSRNVIRPMKEITSLTDSFFWNERTWHLLLEKLLQMDPQQVGISYFFGPSLRRTGDAVSYPKIFSDERLIWSASLDNEGRAIFPPFTPNVSHGIGINDLRADEDGVVRHFSSSLITVPHLALRLAAPLAKQQNSNVRFISGENYLVNFQGERGTYPSISFRAFLEGRFPPDFFRGKTVIIGSSDTPGHRYRTPVGELSRAELMAHITDNIATNRWIQRPSRWWMILYLLIILVTSVWIQFGYPQSIAFVATFWLGTAATALSMWAFDTFYLWLPIQAALIQLGATYIMFLSYHLTVNENLNWRLEQEKLYLTEVEEMKNNFVSLFSHDLKTPIAKIQAICDRLLTLHKEDPLAKDLAALRHESAELHKYIQKILQITRVESKDFKLNKEASDVNELIVNVISQLHPLADAKQIALETKLEPMFLIEIDSLLIREVILNLVENAIKYTPNGGTVLILSREDDDTVRVVVQDTGVGIAPAEQQRVFEKFVRGQQHTHNTKGTGLGLYLVKYFIELHGGNIKMESEVGRGTRFEFDLPIDEATTEPTQELVGLRGPMIPGEVS